jgi:drug/metabolite transporter (DMT)-like permease
MGFYRMGLAAAVLLPLFALKRRGQPPLRRAWLVFPILAGIASGMDHAVWNTALGLTNAANVTLLNYTAPLWVALVTWLVGRERLRAGFWLGLVFTLLGMLAVLGSDFVQHPTLGWGDILALVSSLFYAGYFLAASPGRKYFDALSFTWIAACASAATLLIVALALRQPLTGYSPPTYAAFLGAALLSQVGGYLSLSYALGHLPAPLVAATMIGQPVGTALLAIPLLGERLNPAQLLGGTAVLLGILLVHRNQNALTPAAGVIAPET